MLDIQKNKGQYTHTGAYALGNAVHFPHMRTNARNPQREKKRLHKNFTLLQISFVVGKHFDTGNAYRHYTETAGIPARTCRHAVTTIFRLGLPQSAGMLWARSTRHAAPPLCGRLFLSTTNFQKIKYPAPLRTSTSEKL